MCNWGNLTSVRVPIPAWLSHTGRRRLEVKGIDSCIAAIVKALNAGGVRTVSSCCGHGQRLGEIMLEDGRTLVLVPRENWLVIDILDRVRSERERELAAKIEALVAARAAEEER